MACMFRAIRFKQDRLSRRRIGRFRSLLCCIGSRLRPQITAQQKTRNQEDHNVRHASQRGDKTGHGVPCLHHCGPWSVDVCATLGWLQEHGVPCPFLGISSFAHSLISVPPISSDSFVQGSSPLQIDSAKDFSAFGRIVAFDDKSDQGLENTRAFDLA